MNDEEKKDSDLTIKLLLIGNAFVGKTLIVQKFIDNTFSKTTLSTIGVDLQSKIIDINGKKVKYLIWDTAGEDRMKTMTYSYYRGCHVILIVYDVTDQKSFQNVTTWVECVDKFAKSNVLRILVGNKTDLEDKRVISTDEGKKLAEANGLKFYEISALKITGLYEMFEDIAKEYVEIYEQKALKNFQLKKEDAIKKRRMCC
jgi:Ras-related protein Rab-1A